MNETGRRISYSLRNGLDKISGGIRLESDTFQNGSDIIRYPTVILSPEGVFDKSLIVLRRS